MAVIRVPKTPKKAFDPGRDPSELLLKQIEHLEWAVLPASQRKPGRLPKRKVKTEAQAAERVGQLTQMISAAQAAPPAETGTALPPVTLPRIAPAKARSAKRARAVAAARPAAARTPRRHGQKRDARSRKRGTGGSR